MQVREIKQVLPKADVYEMLPDGKYLIVVGADQMHPDTSKRLAGVCGENVLVLCIADPEGAVRVLEGEGTHDIDLKYPWDKRRAPFDEKSPLMKKLADIMPKELKEPPKPHSFAELKFKLHPIRMAADSFTAFVGDDLPTNAQELRAMLWCFGEIISGELEKRLNAAYKIAQELDAVRPSQPIVVESKPGTSTPSAEILPAPYRCRCSDCGAVWKSDKEPEGCISCHGSGTVSYEPFEAYYARIGAELDQVDKK